MKKVSFAGDVIVICNARVINDKMKILEEYWIKTVGYVYATVLKTGNAFLIVPERVSSYIIVTQRPTSGCSVK